MAFKLDFGIWGSIFAVPTAIVDQHIQLCGASSLKVLLLLLRHSQDELTLQDIAALVGLSVADTQDALNYWTASCVLRISQSGAITFVGPGEACAALQEPASSEPSAETASARPDVQAEQLPAETPNEPATQKVIRLGRPKLTSDSISIMAQQDSEISTLIQEAQVVLGDVLSPSATESLVSLYSYGGMAVELILMVIQYCVSIDKRNVRYIESTAYDWIDRGIDSFDKAEEHIMNLIKFNEIENKVKKAFGITERNLTTKEKDFARKWVDQYQFDISMIKLACERMFDSKGKISFPYCDGILSRWFDKGIKTPRQAVDEMKTPGSSGSFRPAPSYAQDHKTNMGIPKECFDRAHTELQRRRNEARDLSVSRRDEIYSKLPHVKEVDATLAKTGFEISKAVLRGGDTSSLMQKLREKNLALQKEREDALLHAGYPADYLEMPYRCRACEDKGYRPDGSACSCLKELLGT